MRRMAWVIDPNVESAVVRLSVVRDPVDPAVVVWVVPAVSVVVGRGGDCAIASPAGCASQCMSRFNV